MFNNKIFWILGYSLAIVLIFVSMVFASFSLLNLYLSYDGPSVQTPNSNSITIFVAQTVEAELTKQAAGSTPTYTNIPGSIVTATPTASVTPEIITTTNTAVPPTMIVPTFTPNSAACNQAQFIRDLSVQDNSLVPPGAPFVKTWRLKNIGYCTWTTGYMLVFHSGNAMEANRSIPLPRSVEPNQTIDISVPMKSPQKAGTYRGDWMFSDASGTRFGLGSNGDQTFWVQIRVKNLVNTNLVYDFAENSCHAEWKSSNGMLSCLGTSSSSDGFVILLDSPQLENRQEDEITLWTHPNNSNRGWISGMYPEFIIQPNQHFSAWVGCLVESKGCNVIFRLDYKNLTNGNIRNLGAWNEIYDGEVTKIDLDLSQHAGKHVRFILTVEVNGGDPTRANAFWFVPGIVAVFSPTATQIFPTATINPTFTPAATETPTETPILTEIPLGSAIGGNSF